MKESKVFEILAKKFPDYNVPYCLEVAEQINQLYSHESILTNSTDNGELKNQSP